MFHFGHVSLAIPMDKNCDNKLLSEKKTQRPTSAKNVINKYDSDFLLYVIL